MASPCFPRIRPHLQRKSERPGQAIRLLHASLVMFVLAVTSRAQTQTKPASAELSPRPAVSAILEAFDKYEVVGMPEAHGLKDLDDFILALIRNGPTGQAGDALCRSSLRHKICRVPPVCTIQLGAQCIWANLISERVQLCRGTS